MRRGRGQDGIAAVELAFLLPVIVLLMAWLLLAGQLFWHYTVLQHAVHNAARYLASVPPAEISDAAKGPGAMADASRMVLDSVANAGLYAMPVASQINVQCGASDGSYVTCGTGVLPATVRVSAFIDVPVKLFIYVPSLYGDGLDKRLASDVVMAYAN